MQLGLVIGNASSTVKHPSLQGWKLLVVRLLAADGVSADGEPVLVFDPLGAGAGDRVVVTNDGRSTREMIGHDNTPARWQVIGIQDA